MALDLGWLLQNAETVKNVVTSVLSDETAEDIEELKKLLSEGTIEVKEFKARIEVIVQKGISVALDLVREPAAAAGHSVGVSRSLTSKEAEIATKRLQKMQNSVVE